MSTKKNNKSEKVEDVKIDTAEDYTTIDSVNNEAELTEVETEVEKTPDGGWVYIDSVGADPGRKSRVK